MIVALAADHECELHKTHAPRNLTVEYHHLIPVAWQLKTPSLPDPQPSPGEDPDGRGHLWDDRGVWLCPTSHRNTHYWIVELMKAIAAAANEDVALAEKTVLGATKERGHVPHEFPQALLGLQRAQPYVSLLALTAEREFGQI